MTEECFLLLPYSLGAWSSVLVAAVCLVFALYVSGRASSPRNATHKEDYIQRATTVLEERPQAGEEPAELGA